MTKKKLLFTQADMNQNGAALSLVNFLNKIDFNKYEAEILIIKECDENVISLLPKEVKISYLYKNHPLFDNIFLKGFKEAKEKKLILPFIFNKIFKNSNEKHIKKLKISLRKSWVPDTEYDVAISFDEQSFRYLKKINSKKKRQNSVCLIVV